MQGRCRLIVFAAAAACLLAAFQAGAGGLPAAPQRVPEAETAPEPAERHPAPDAEVEEDFGFPEDFTEPEIEEFTMPREEPGTPGPAPSRFRIMFVLLAAAAAAIGLLHYFKRS